MIKGATFEVRCRTLDWNGSPTHLVAYKTTTLQGVTTEAEALKRARERVNELRKYHLFVDLVRIGPRGGERLVS